VLEPLKRVGSFTINRGLIDADTILISREVGEEESDWGSLFILFVCMDDALLHCYAFPLGIIQFTDFLLY
jgi:hypothetical protein